MRDHENRVKAHLALRKAELESMIDQKREMGGRMIVMYSRAAVEEGGPIVSNSDLSLRLPETI